MDKLITTRPGMAYAILVLLAAQSLAIPAGAQQQDQAPAMPGMKMMNHQAPASAAPAGSLMGAMDKMNKDMAAVPMTGDTDRDFVAMMLPHHQGAVDMARAELAKGKDPKLRKLARDIVAAQEREIKEMHAWQAQHSAKP